MYRMDNKNTYPIPILFLWRRCMLDPRLLARKGRLEAIKRERLWLATHQALADYRRSVE
jgi:hypothetical protein